MIFHATTHPLAIDYKLKGKIYNVHPIDLKAAQAGDPSTPMTDAPFDTQTVLPGETWTLPEGATFIREQHLQNA